MANPGVAPPDFSTEIGQFRLLGNDTTYVALDPPVVDQGDYTYWSDAEIQGYLDASPDSIYRALALAYRGLAAAAAMGAVSIADYDLKVDQRDLYKALLSIADGFDNQADLADIGDAFEIVPTGERCERPAELSEWPVNWWC